jgi:toxin-antitoxin system PIN domain toxin
VSASLLDVNVLIALAYEWHVGHSLVQGWFRESAGAWATCPLTESGFVRIACNPSAIEQSVKVREALRMISTITVRPGYRFWPADINFSEAVQPFRERVFGHRQVTDAYLLGLAIKNKGRLVTLDRGIEALAGEDYRQHVTVLGE